MFLEKCQYYFHMVWDNIVGVWSHWKAPIVSVESDPSQKMAEQPVVKTRRKRGENKAIKNDILHNLDKYFRYIKRMRKSDREAYDLYRQIGAQFITRKTSDDFDETISLGLPERWKTVRPSFGCVLVPAPHDESDEKTKDRVDPRFLYFRKHKTLSANVQVAPKGWDVYTFHVAFYFDNVEWTYDAAIGIDPYNNLKALRIRVSDDVVIKSKDKHNRGSHRIHRSKWTLPEIAKIRKNNSLTENKTAEEFICEIFSVAANFWEMAQFKEVEVRAVKGNIAARFNITGADTARLFQDRERIGNKKTRIFHAVRPYVRKSGAMVRLHFKGERRFSWNGYEIMITVPGKDFSAFLPEFEASAIPEEDMIASGDKGYDSKQVGKFIVQNTVGRVNVPQPDAHARGH